MIDQHAQRLERLREEREKAIAQGATQKQLFENKFEPCLVCGDRASGKLFVTLLLKLSFKYCSPKVCFQDKHTSSQGNNDMKSCHVWCETCHL